MTAKAESDPVARAKALAEAIKSLPRPLLMRELEVEQQISDVLAQCETIRSATCAHPPKPASESEREWGAQAKQIAEFASKIGRLAPLEREKKLSLAESRDASDWHAAAHELSRMDDGMKPPHTKPEGAPARRVWNTQQGMLEVVRSLDWLLAVTRLAEQRARAAKREKGGATPDRAHDALIKAFLIIYRDATGLRPDVPYFNQITGLWVGSFLNFADPIFAVFSRHHRGQTAGLAERAIKKLFPKPKGWRASEQA